MAPKANKTSKSEGVITRFEKGYGFIRPNKGGEDVFVHGSDITLVESVPEIRNGQVVEYKVEFDSQRNKNKAVNVVITRRSGVVTRFSEEKGFGFIQPHMSSKGKEEELFVHGSEIYMVKEQEWPNLRKGYEVEYTKLFDGNKYQASDVTGVNGTPIVYIPPKKLAGGIGECFKCGQRGHMAKNCTGGGRSEAGVAGKGRFAGSSGSAGGNCYKCGKPGHFERDCLTTLTRGGGRGGGRRSGGKCFVCGKEGHYAKDCPSGTSEKTN